jgi:hypothetical protein
MSTHQRTLRVTFRPQTTFRTNLFDRLRPIAMSTHGHRPLTFCIGFALCQISSGHMVGEKIFQRSETRFSNERNLDFVLDQLTDIPKSAQRAYSSCCFPTSPLNKSVNQPVSWLQKFTDRDGCIPASAKVHELKTRRKAPG